MGLRLGISLTARVVSLGGVEGAPHEGSQGLGESR
jgi:hypothetical protein